MPTTTLTKTAARVLLAHTQQATANVTVGAAIDVSTMVGPGLVLVKMGRTVATALTNNLKFRIDSSAKTSGNDEWFPLYEFASGSGLTAASASTVVDVAFNAGDTTFDVAAITGVTAGDVLYLRETGVPANSEWVRVKSVSSLTVTLEEPVTRGHTNSITVTDLGEVFSPIPLDLSACVRIRLVVDSASLATGQTVDVIAWLVTADSALTV